MNDPQPEGHMASYIRRPEPHDRTTRYDQGPVAAPSRRFSFCLSSRARVLVPVRRYVTASEHLPDFGFLRKLSGATSNAASRARPYPQNPHCGIGGSQFMQISPTRLAGVRDKRLDIS